LCFVLGDDSRMYECMYMYGYVYCHLGWRTLVLKCNKNNYDYGYVHIKGLVADVRGLEEQHFPTERYIYIYIYIIYIGLYMYVCMSVCLYVRMYVCTYKDRHEKIK
jgi:hypothetical protein